MFDSAVTHQIHTVLHMASIKPHAGGYRAFLCVAGVRESKVFRTKREAAAWASVREAEIRNAAGKSPGEKHTLGEALKKYGEEVSPGKKGKRWELVRLAAFERSLPVTLAIGKVTPALLGQWRDGRLKSVSAGSVIREIALLSHVFETARREWGWISANPLADVRRPPSPDHRSRVITRGEVSALLRAMHYTRGPVRSVTHAVACCVLLALRTGLRAGEICSLPWCLVYADYATVDGKTGVRDVALTTKARRIIEQLRGFDDALVAGIKTATLDALFRKYRSRAGLSGFTFHDTRHTAATWIAQKIPVLDLCKMFGWSNPAMAMVYYNPSASDISKRLSARPALHQ